MGATMTNPLLRDYMVGKIKGAIAEAHALRGISHQLLKGRLREIVYENLLSPLLPPSFMLGSGAVVDHEGGQSGEVDIIVCNKSIMPPFNIGVRDGLFPVETCLYALEIKSTLKSEDIKTTIRKFRSVHDLATLPGGGIVENAYFPVTALFAFSSKVNEAKMLAKLADANKEASAAVVQIVCIVGQGYWRWANGAWWQFPPTVDHQEVLDFLGGTLNTAYSAQFALAGAKIGQYIIQENRERRVNL